MRASDRRLTIADIARLAGVSIGTASRALNDAYGVSPVTRQRVLDVADRYAYVVSPEASRLARGSTDRVAVLVPHLSRWFFAEVLAGVVQGLGEANLDVLLYNLDSVLERHRFFATLPARRKVDAVVVIAFPVDEAERARLNTMGVHVVSAGGRQAEYLHASIDDSVAATQAAHHLITLGHERVAMIEAIDPEHPTLVPDRSTAFRRAMAEAGRPLHEDLVVSTDWGSEQGARAASQLLALRQPPTAIYAHSDEVAAGAIRTIRRAGLRIPTDISVIGIDDHPIAAVLDLTTIRQPARGQGRAAARITLGLLRESESPPTSITLPTELVVRHSTSAYMSTSRR